MFTLLLVLAMGSCFVSDLTWYVKFRLYLLHTEILGVTGVSKANLGFYKVNRLTSDGYEMDLPR